MPKQAQELIGVSEAVQITGRSRRTLLRMVARQELVPVMKVGGGTGPYLFDRMDVEALSKVAAA